MSLAMILTFTGYEEAFAGNELCGNVNQLYRHGEPDFEECD